MKFLTSQNAPFLASFLGLITYQLIRKKFNHEVLSQIEAYQEIFFPTEKLVESKSAGDALIVCAASMISGAIFFCLVPDYQEGTVEKFF